ncbi:MAG: hypothetical protein E7562_01685 [Ruminococcaceae bacterium]|nr:hypothetical protein [Oscillospiraceae bacterium]
MKKILSLLLAAVMIFCFAACGDDDTSSKAKDKERKRAAKGQDTTTATGQVSDEIVLDTGLLTPLDKTYAKSNKADLVYDANIFINLANQSAGTVNIACVGDSITYGTASSDPEKASYPVQLQKLLKARFGNKFKVKNYGHAGSFIAAFDRSNAATLQYINTDEYLKLRKDKPEVVILMLGINDIGYANSAENLATIQKDYVNLISKIKALKSNPLVFVCTPLVRTTAYSSYASLELLRSVVISAANETKSYVIDTYNITKEYFSSALYETDCLHPNDAGYKYLAQTVMNAVAYGLTEYKDAAENDTSNYVVYVDSAKGSYDSVGATADKPTSSFARAVELCKGGGTIVVSGRVTPATTSSNSVKVFIAPENANKIKVTSIDPYDGKDYRDTNNARIYMSASMYLQGDYLFEKVTFDFIAASTKIVCNYNNITFGSGVNCTVTSGGYPVLIFGYDVVTTAQSHEDLSCKKDCTLTVNSGTFTYLRGGNYRAASTATSSLNYGTVKSGVTANIIVNGGTFTVEDGVNKDAGSRLSSALGQNGMESGSTVNFIVNGGTFKGSLFAVPRMNPYTTSGAPDVAGKINITVNGGLLNGSGIDYLQTFSGDKKPALSGSYNLTINGGTFGGGSNLSFAASGCPNSVLTLGTGNSYLESWADISGFTTVNK